ncbi:hypothetical protein KC19_9G086700 [Ceratodon purpureus]|uniref:Uncharacterized protein n=1 Tax=Ceratodon purpureus TaxID=3225 RepID=A0A8T0GQ50_CERPU|nr:hypothetical protein KC19_9G086700 [Ceratodon purpureus]
MSQSVISSDSNLVSPSKSGNTSNCLHPLIAISSNVLISLKLAAFLNSQFLRVNIRKLVRPWRSGRSSTPLQSPTSNVCSIAKSPVALNSAKLHPRILNSWSFVNCRRFGFSNTSRKSTTTFCKEIKLSKLPGVACKRRPSKSSTRRFFSFLKSGNFNLAPDLFHNVSDA